MIKDSGERRMFDSGAVRDIQEGKGRCDLLPLDVISLFLGDFKDSDKVLQSIHSYILYGNFIDLLKAVKYFCDDTGIDYYTAVLEVSKHYEEGAKKYDERNWEKGIPVHCYIDSGIRHYLKHCRGDSDECHDRAFIWNMFCAVWTHTHKPQLIDLPFIQEEGV